MLSFKSRPAGPPESTGSQPAPARSEDLREASRRPAYEVPSIRGLRISPPGVDATLVNISPSGLLGECSERLKAGKAVTVAFEGSFEPRTVEARVARCAVSSMGKDGRLRYHVGIAFAKPIRLDDVREGGAAELDTPAETGTPESKDAPRGKAESGRTVNAPKGGASLVAHRGGAPHGVNDATAAGSGESDRGAGAPGVSNRGAGAPGVTDRGAGATGVNDIPRPVVRNRW
jgi:hypothetical protein